MLIEKARSLKDYASVMERAVFIRCFEQALLDLSSKGRLFGTTHTCIGQELTAVLIADVLNVESDYIFSNHRCHGHFLALGGSPRDLLHEIMGLPDGVCKGFGGSQHLHWKNFFSNGIQGGGTSNAVGTALSLKQSKSSAISVAFVGDGTFGEGIVYESLNFAAKRELPFLLVVEDNGYAQSTLSTDVQAGAIHEKIMAFGIQCSICDTSDLSALRATIRDAVRQVREHRLPHALIAKNLRVGPHSKGDDTRLDEVIRLAVQKDCLSSLLSAGDPVCTSAMLRAQAQMATLISEATAVQIDSTSFPSHLLDTNAQILALAKASTVPSVLPRQRERFVERINDVLHDELHGCASAFVIGEDIGDPYGGAFKATRGLQARFYEQVIPTTISELGLVGWSVGSALAGDRPIVEIMFSDFMGLAYDQILNHAAKYPWMFGENLSLDLTIRTATGAGRGYGPTHSQSIEKYLLPISGIMLIAPNAYSDIEELYRLRSSSQCCTRIFLEHKLLYPFNTIQQTEKRANFFAISSPFSPFSPRHFRSQIDDLRRVLLVSYGYQLEVALDAAEALGRKNEWAVDVLALELLSPLDPRELNTRFSEYEGVVYVGENDSTDPLIGMLAGIINDRLDCPRYRSISNKHSIIPSSGHIEKIGLPNISAIELVIMEILDDK